MTKASTKKGMAGKLLAAGCSLALAASLTPAAALTAFAAGLDADPALGEVNVVVQQGSTAIAGFDATANVKVDLNDTDVEKVKGNQSTLWFKPDVNDNHTEGTWNVATSTEAGVVPFTEIFENAKSTGITAASYWQPGAKLEVTDGASTVTFTYEQLASATNFYPNTSKSAINTTSPVTTVKPGIALQATFSEVLPSSIAAVAADANAKALKANPVTVGVAGNVLSVGLSAANYDVANMAQWMSAVKTLTIVLPAQEYQNVPRIYGEDWNDTMNAVVNASGFDNQVENFVVASSNNYQDALTASGLAGALQCPLLLTDKDELTKQVADQISARTKETGAHVYIIGGPLAVSENVKTKINQLTAIAGKITDPVVRLAGETAAETSLAVYKKMAEMDETTSNAGMKKAIVTTSIAFQDAMSISPYTYSTGTPVVLTGDGNTLGSDTLTALGKQTTTTTGNNKLAEAVVLGGNLAVSSSVEGQLFGAGVAQVKRIGEDTAWETSNAIAEYLTAAAPDGIAWSASPAQAAVATGDNYLDALVASQYCAQSTNKQALLLVGNGQGGDYCVANYIDDNSTLTKVNVIGGPQAVSNAIAAQINKAIS